MCLKLHPNKKRFALPAMLALIKQIIDPEIRARTDISTITLRFSVHNAPKLPIIMPSAPKLAKPQIANVQIAELRT